MAMVEYASIYIFQNMPSEIQIFVVLTLIDTDNCYYFSGFVKSCGSIN